MIHETPENEKPPKITRLQPGTPFVLFPGIVFDLLTQILSFDLVVPAWQMVIFVSLISLFMIERDYKLYMITTVLFTSYWGFLFYRTDFIGAFTTFPLTFYAYCGLVHIAITLIALRIDIR